MNEQLIFTKDNLLVNSLEYDAEPSGNGIIYLHLENGSIEIDVESYFGQMDYASYCFSYTEDDIYNYYYLDDNSIEVVNEYLIENNIRAKYIEEVSEAASQTF